MNLNEFKQALTQVGSVEFFLENGKKVPAHFHVTEIGLLTKHFIDCGGKMHEDRYASMQIWVAEDLDHRLSPEKLIGIIDLSEKMITDQNIELEVEFQLETIGKFGVDFQSGQFILTNKNTDCLAKENCGVPVEKQKRNLVDLTPAGESCCTPGGGCC